MYSVSLPAPLPPKPRVLVFCDANLTAAFLDTNKKKSQEYLLIATLAESAFAQWDQAYEPMTFRQYVWKVIPGDKSNDEVKAAREEMIGTFFQWMEERSHPALEDVRADYWRIKQKLTDPETGVLKFTVFRSIYVMFEKFRKMGIPFIFILRSFGSDLPGIVQELAAHPLGVKVTRTGRFDDGKLSLEGEPTIEKIRKIFKTFLNSNEHFAIRDNWFTWHAAGELGSFGKPYIYDATGCTKGVHNLSLFFDDNITGAEQDIVSVHEINGDEVPASALLGKYLFPVVTKEAILDDKYFSRLVKKAVKEWQAAFTD